MFLLSLTTPAVSIRSPQNIAWVDGVPIAPNRVRKFRMKPAWATAMMVNSTIWSQQLKEKSVGPVSYSAVLFPAQFLQQIE